MKHTMNMALWPQTTHLRQRRKLCNFITGEASENRIKELKLGFAANRMPCGQFEASIF